MKLIITANENNMSLVSTETKRNVALSLSNFNILQFGEFKLKSGITAPFYIDLRIVQSHPEALHAITKIYAEMLNDLPREVFLAGIPEAGIPIATAVGYETNRPLIQPRSKIKEHGKGKLIEGDWQPGDKVAIIDDLVTKGDSKIEAIEQFRAANLKVISFYLLIDREMGGKQLVEKAGYSVNIAMTMTEIIDILLAEKKISANQRQTMITFMRSG
ncbi:MAG TPA: orotate phosphoribosyltransferase [Candidatus Saccharimonadales bacterium]|nr:orotate phosphoribosyltransferase [Candidatus Saccharimonadales bacterium]